MRLFLCLTLSLLLHAMLLVATQLEHAKPAQRLPSFDVELRPVGEFMPAEPEDPLPEELASIPDAQALIEPLPLPTLPPPSPPPLAATPVEAPREKVAPKRDVTAVRQAQSKLMERLLYPPQAITQGLEGEVILLLTLDANGRVITATVARSSGHTLLDDAAIDAARTLGPLRSTAGEILLPVAFALD